MLKYKKHRKNENRNNKFLPKASQSQNLLLITIKQEEIECPTTIAVIFKNKLSKKDKENLFLEIEKSLY